MERRGPNSRGSNRGANIRGQLPLAAAGRFGGSGVNDAVDPYPAGTCSLTRDRGPAGAVSSVGNGGFLGKARPTTGLAEVPARPDSKRRKKNGSRRNHVCGGGRPAFAGVWQEFSFGGQVSRPGRSASSSPQLGACIREKNDSFYTAGASGPGRPVIQTRHLKWKKRAV